MADKLSLSGLTVSVDERDVLKTISLSVKANEIVSVIGPAHSGKTTLLRTINRLIENDPGFSRSGDVMLDGVEVRRLDRDTLRQRVGLIFATPVPLPGTIFDNIAYGPRLKARLRRSQLAERVEQSLRAAALWDEVKDRLQTSALRLSGGQQQRLCIARTIAVDPEVIMMDEPTSGLDPISTAQIENAMRELKSRYTWLLVTNNVKQAARVSDTVAFFLSGELVEVGEAAQLYTRPRDRRTDDYLSGRIG
ncbi:phosphate ABC transporter ATP-binding protein [candidate division WOR-3 bacterium]|nr:phosphate ABC transporter ATP-binding protein [candidate division WOR-3 bacterium]